MSGALNRHFFLAIMVSASSILVLMHGARLGSSLVTGIFLVAATAALFAFSDWRKFLFNRLDALFVLFVAGVGTSFAINGLSGTPKEIQLLMISLAAYPAGRLFVRGAIAPAFVWTTSAIALIGAVVTVFALLDQWGDQMTRPVVFGYHHAASAFLLSLGFALIAIASQDLNARRIRIVCALFCAPTFVFGASMVRFVFAALLAGLLVAAKTSHGVQRRCVYAVMAMVVTAALAGTLTRYETWTALGGYIISNARSADAPAWEPTSECGVIVNDSIGVRRVLSGDAVRAIPSAGFFGLGFTNYKNVSCFKAMSPHNSFLQALIEFGWIGGAALAAMILAALLQLRRPALVNNEARFVLCALVYVALIEVAHGNLAGYSALLFLFLGYAARIHEDYPVLKA